MMVLRQMLMLGNCKNLLRLVLCARMMSSIKAQLQMFPTDYSTQPSPAANDFTSETCEMDRGLEKVAYDLILILATILWDSWSRTSYGDTAMLDVRILGALYGGPLCLPLYLGYVLEKTYESILFSMYVARMPGFEAQQAAARIIYSCEVIVAFTDEELLKELKKKDPHFRLIVRESKRQEIRRHAMTVGDQSHCYDSEGRTESGVVFGAMGRPGKVALFRANLIPHRNQLEIARGNYSWHTLLMTGVSACIYIGPVLVRMGNEQNVSPLEATGCLLSVLVLIRSCLYIFAAPSERPLLIYPNEEKERALLRSCEDLPEDANCLSMKSALLMDAIQVLLHIGLINVTRLYRKNMAQKFGVETARPADFAAFSLFAALVLNVVPSGMNRMKEFNSSPRSFLVCESPMDALTNGFKLITGSISFYSMALAYIMAGIVTVEKWETNQYNTQTDYSLFLSRTWHLLSKSSNTLSAA